ncbi:ABC transporter substrate-binding protein [Streptomyces fragilis]|uniref:ABC transporter substrate-binding protein n=1 Tax=Streptomyces fragilis TaxID=67301 RepID=A0ABV2YR52_9ACTN|nr:ABC transporter substrate-binding protein [Streptomyces fragilis]
MRTFNKRTTRAIVVALAAGSLALTGCSSNDGGSKGESKAKTQDEAKKQQKPVQYADAAASNGPAAPVKGAKAGGTIKAYSETDLTHMDPGQIYVSDAGLWANLVHRGLTNFQEDADGNLTVVGDLATDSGKSSDDGKTWTYTLKEGLEDENGNPINSADVRHTIERQYAEFIFDGPTYLQTWLSGADYRKDLPDGGFKKKHLPDSVLETPDDKTIIFHFEKPQLDVPQMLTMPGYALVPEETDTKEKYDKKPVATGPYKIAEFKPGKSLKLVRNDKWKAESDPVRNAYPDAWEFEIGITGPTQTQRLIADQGDDKNAIQFTGSVDAPQIPKVVRDKKLRSRTVEGYQPYVWQLNFNLDRVKNKKVRDAITIGINAEAVLALDGGSYAGDPAPNYFAPTLPGYKADYDPYGRLKNPKGDVAKAKELLKDVPAEDKKIVYAYRNNELGQKQKATIESSLTSLGLDVVAKEVEAASFYEQIGKVDNPYDVYMTGWGQDWPSPSTVVTPVYDPSQLQDGSPNYSHIRDEKVQQLIDKALGQKPEEAAATWQEAHEYLLEEINPGAPLYYTKQLQLFGSNIGGARYSVESSYINVNDLFLKS